MEQSLGNVFMPLIQGGPPEWIWERTPDTIRWELVSSKAPDRETRYELRVQCGLEIMRWQFFTVEEIADLFAVLGDRLQKPERPSMAKR
jgi:hypothetical protein